MKKLIAAIITMAPLLLSAQPLLRNVISTNPVTVVTFGGSAQVLDTILGWDATDKKFVDFLIGTNLIYTHASHTLSASGTGSGVQVASTIPGVLSSNAGPTVVTITNLPAAGITGTLTNNTTGNAATASTATNAVNSTNFWGILSPTNLPPGLSSSNYVGTFTGNGSGLSNVVTSFNTNGYTTNIPPATIDAQMSGQTNVGRLTVVSNNITAFTGGTASNFMTSGQSTLMLVYGETGTTNEIAMTDNLQPGILVAKTGGFRGAGPGITRVTKGPSIVGSVVLQGANNLGGGVGMALAQAGGTNNIGNTGGTALPIYSANANSGGVNDIASLGLFSVAAAGVGSSNNINASSGLGFANALNGGRNQQIIYGAFQGYADGGTNLDSSGNGYSFAGYAKNGGNNFISAAGGRMSVFNNGSGATNTGQGSQLLAYVETNGVALTSGQGAFAIGYADPLFPNLSATAKGSIAIGAVSNGIANTIKAGENGAFVFVSTNGVGINTNAPAAALDLAGNGHVSGNLAVEGFLEASHGSLTMCTGIVNVATSASTNLINNIWSYAHIDAPLGAETNTSFVVTNAGHFFVSFGAAMASNASGAGTISLHVATNGVLCDSIIFFEAPSNGATSYETGFKEFAIDLPAMCRVSLFVGQTTAQTVNLKNVCFNMKGGN